MANTRLNYRPAYLNGGRCWALWDNDSQQGFSPYDDKDNKLTVRDAYVLLDRYFDWVDGKWWEELVSASYWIHSVEVAIKNEIIPSDMTNEENVELVNVMESAVRGDALTLARDIIKDAKELYDGQD